MKPLEDTIQLDRISTFLSRVDYRGENGCWNWMAGKKLGGYGEFKPHLGQNNRAAHTIMWEIRNGAVPEGLFLDHLCRNTTCVNPTHLEPVTCRENVLRGESIPAKNARKTHCGRCGGEFDYFYIRNGSPRRACKACQHDRTRQYRARKKGL